jgi:carboxyl-terminal processing protease
MQKNSIFLILIVLIFFGNKSYSQGSHDFEISKNLDIYTSLIQQLNLHYVDDIEPGRLSKIAIDAMLKDIDPYTVYYPESNIEDVRFLQTGKYGGIGSFVHIKNGDIVVGMPYPGFPFYRAGIRAGDIILKIDNESVKGKKMTDISEKLKGVAGTELSILYKDAKEGKEHEVNIKREEIEVKDVPYFGMLNNTTAYVKLTGFKQHAAAEVKSAIDSLLKTNKVESVVLDLRDNGGGLLIQAVQILDLFVDRGETIVSTKGKTKTENNAYKTQMPALYPDMKVVVVVNKNSASASEIVAGSFQDLDRGVILGQKSYGKGLVQKVFPLSYRAQAKITVAKYYIPSGRCIQSINYQHKDAKGKAIRVPDSLMAVFTTKNGRKVKDAGGIIPDVEMDDFVYPQIAINLSNKYEIFDFATAYVYSHDSIKSIKDFEISDELYNQFVDFVRKDSFNYTLSIEKDLKEIKKLAINDSLHISNEIAAIENKLQALKGNEIYKYKASIKSLLKREIVSRYFYMSGQVESQLSEDKEIIAAKELLNDESKYFQILGVK